MIRHLVMWNFKDGLSDEEKARYAQEMKEKVEALDGLFEGVLQVKVIHTALPGSNRDVGVDDLFTDEEALQAYQVHPEHVEVGKWLSGFLQDRTCIDYVVD